MGMVSKQRLLAFATPFAFLLLDTAVIYFAFVGALKLRLGAWSLLLHETRWGSALLLSLVVYLVALTLSGLYRTRPSTMHLDAFLKVGGALLIGWAASLTLIYLMLPAQIPPRSVTAAHCMFSIVGVLGFRAVLRYTYEQDTSRFALPIQTGLPTLAAEDLLQRTPLEIDRMALRDYLAGRTVLVTGAGGSIGAELSQQLLDLRPFRLVLVDVSEYNLYQLENALRKQPFEGELHFRIADVRDEAIMRMIFSNLRPDVVFHAAAYKHVPLMERHPVEAFRNNTITTIGLMRLCEQFDTEQFVFISTDKAVTPSSVLGATKRLAEWYIRTVHAPMNCKTVRFGNVLGSQGSVVPLFTEQIAAGGPVTITHPDMDRYFMSAHEACCLILQTLLLNDAPVYTLEMGAAVRIQDLARRMIDRLRPDDNIQVEFTGTRPGEKLHEELWDHNETPVTSAHPSIIGLQSNAPFSRFELDDYFAYLENLCIQNRTEELRKALFQNTLQAVNHTTT